MTVKTVRKRDDIPSHERWNLEDLYASMDLWENDFARVKQLILDLKAFDGRLTTPDVVRRCFSLSDEIGCLLERLYVYAHMRHHQDTIDVTNHGRVARIKQLSVDVTEAGSFIDPELLGLPEEQLRSLIEAEELKTYRFSMEDKLRMKPHTLPKEQEAIVARAGVLAQAPQTIYSMLNNADLKFGTILDDEGAEIELTHSRYGRLIENRDRRVRREAFEKMYAGYRSYQNTIASTYNAQVQKNIFYAQVLKYPSALEMALFGDNIPAGVYSNLISSVKKGLPDFHRYLALRKTILKLDALHLYDLNVPLVEEIRWQIPYEEATEMVTRALRLLGDDYVKIVRKAWSSRWIDVFENQGKRSGAYSWGAYGFHPYILLNHEDTVQDLFTIAHEMGHAVHSYLADAQQIYRYAGYTIFIAEIASTLNEALLMHYLVESTTDPSKRLYLLAHQAEKYRGTVFVQTMFAEFEKMVHEMAERGEALTLESLNEVYYKLLQEYYGDGVTLDPDIEIGWMRIPHFYQSFYVFKYATGFAAAQSFYRNIAGNGQASVSRYLDLLKSGGKDYPLKLLRNAGLDMEGPEPVDSAMSGYASVMAELERLLG